MTTIVDALNRIARQCSIKAPTSWVTATRDDHVELRDDFFLETVDDILERVDLPSPIGAQVVLSTLSSATNTDESRTFTLPTTFKRLHRDQWAVYDPDQDRPCVPVSTDGEFTYLTDTGTAGIVHYYVLEGYDENWDLKIYRDPGSDASITLSYNTKNWMANGSGTAGSMFTAEDDVLLLPRRIVETGAIWRFRERRGLPYQDRYADYEAQIARLSNDRRNRRVIDMGEREAVRWQDLVPAFIPSS